MGDHYKILSTFLCLKMFIRKYWGKNTLPGVIYCSMSGLSAEGQGRTELQTQVLIKGLAICR